MISSSRRNSVLLAVLTVTLIAALAGCRGFFVKPTLSSITVTPSTPNLQVGQTQQMTATGVNNDGSTSSLRNGVTWTSATPSQVTVSSTGLVKAIANTSTTGVEIKAESGIITGSTTVTVGQASTSVTVTSDFGTTLSLATDGGSAITFTATQGGSDVTNSATWSSSNTGIISTPSAGQATLVGSLGTVTITARTSTGTPGSVQVTVEQ